MIAPSGKRGTKIAAGWKREGRREALRDVGGGGRGGRKHEFLFALRYNERGFLFCRCTLPVGLTTVVGFFELEVLRDSAMNVYKTTFRVVYISRNIFVTFVTRYWNAKSKYLSSNFHTNHLKVHNIDQLDVYWLYFLSKTQE